MSGFWQGAALGAALGMLFVALLVASARSGSGGRP